MIFLVSLLSIFAEIESCCLNCLFYNPTTGLCSTCLLGKLESGVCISGCSDGLSEVTSGKCSATSSLLRINTDFSAQKSFSGSTVGDFSSPGSDFLSDTSMKPTHSRGFYMKPSTFLKSSTSHLFGPNISIKMFFLAFSPGKLFSMSGSTSISYSSGNLKFSLLLLNLPNLLTVSVESPLTQGVWNSVLATAQQVSGLEYRLSVVINGIETIFSPTLAEFLENPRSFAFVGDFQGIESAEGYFFILQVFNTLDFGLISGFQLETCAYRQYFDGNFCFNCKNDCLVQCLYQDTCTTCRFTNCNQCSGYGESDCLTCDNLMTPPYCCDFLCKTCASWGQCTSCIEGVVVDGICLYSWPSSLTQLIASSDFGLYENYVTGSSQTSFNPFNNGEPSDPVPYKNRGLYFNSFSSISYLTSVSLSFEFTISLIIKDLNSQSLNLLTLVPFLTILNQNLEIVTILTSLKGETNQITLNSMIPSNIWSQLTLLCRFDKSLFRTTLEVYKNLELITSFSSAQSVFRMNSTGLKIGEGFHGFLYSFNCKNFPDVVSVTFHSCLQSMDDECLNDCSPGEFLDAGLVCKSCLGSCLSGCKNDQNCNICFDSLCIKCKNFKQGDCLECDSTSKLVNGNCIICHPTCQDCSDVYINSCTACKGLDKLIENVCVNQCPDGYTESNGVCFFSTSLVFKAVFYDDWDFVSPDTLALVLDPVNTPKKILRRGRFLDSNLMTVTFVMPFIFTFNFWVNAFSAGTLFKRTDFHLIFAQNYFNVYIKLNDGSAFNLNVDVLVKTWRFFEISVDVVDKGLTQVRIKVQGDEKIMSLSNQSAIFNSFNDNLLIGGDGFIGFLYSFSIYNQADQFDKDFSSSCSSLCDHCPSDLECLGTCSIGFPPFSCSAPCSSNCLDCYSDLSCKTCKPGTFELNGECFCTSQVWSPDFSICEVRQCYKFCAVCNTLTGTCSSCLAGYSKLSTTCVRCPTGYKTNEDSCELLESLVLNLKFDALTGVLFDSSRNIPAVTGSSQRFYPDYEDDDPIPSYQKGFYFNGRSSVVRLPGNELSNEFISFSPEFVVELWIRPYEQGSIFCKQNLRFSEILCVDVRKNEVFVMIRLSNATDSSFLASGLGSGRWNFFVFSVFLDSGVFFSFHSGVDEKTSKIMIFEYLHDDSEPGYATIGAKRRQNDEFFNYYKGFLYNLKVFNSAKSFKIQHLGQCSGLCESCIIETGECLSSCGLREFGSKECKKCQNCDHGCVNNLTCSLSGDPLCLRTENFLKCEACIKNASLKAGKCVCDKNFAFVQNECKVCENGFFEADHLCHPCFENCLKCDKSSCFACREGFSLIDNKCNDLKLFLDVSMTEQCQLVFKFSENLSFPLSASDFSITPSISEEKMILKTLNSTSYSVKITKKLKKGTKYVLKMNNLESFKGHHLSKDEYILNSQCFSLSPASISGFESFYRFLLVILSAILLFLSLLAKNPSSFWSFLSSIQYLSFSYFINFPFPARITELLRSLRVNLSCPSLFDLTETRLGKNNELTKAEDLGFPSTSAIFNLDFMISLLLILLLFNIFLKISAFLAKVCHLKKIESFLTPAKGFEKSFLARFWIQAYLEFQVCMYISFRFTNMQDVLEALNLYISSCILVRFKQYLSLLTLAVSIKISRNSQSWTTRNNVTESWYGTLFYEFKDDVGALKSYFYTIYFVKRFLYACVLFQLAGFPSIQCSICFTLSVGVMFSQTFFIIITKKPFSEKVLNFCYAVSELCTSAIFLLYIALNLNIEQGSKDEVETCIVVFINIVVWTHILGSVFMFLKKIRKRFCKKTEVCPEPDDSSQGKPGVEEKYVIKESPEANTPANTFTSSVNRVNIKELGVRTDLSLA